MIHLHFNPLYIDPGTGSMLFSILIGAAATLYFLLRAVIIKVKVFFSGGRAAVSNTLYPYVIYSEGKQYWNVFKPVVEEFETRQQELLYLTSSEDDPVFENTYHFIKSEFIGEGNKAYARLNIISANFVLMTTPSLNVYQLKRSKSVNHYSHVLHMPSDATTYRLFGLDYFDSVLLTGDYQAKDIRILEKQRSLPEKQLITVGCTYLDVYAEKIKQLPIEDTHPFTVLVSPSWGASGLLKHYGERLLDPLAESGWRIIVRPHPQSKKSEADMLETLAKRYSTNPNVQWDYERENIYSLSRADIMISDFSGIIFDFMFLCDKPVIYVSQDMDLRPYDADDVPDELWQFRILREIGIELKEEQFKTMAEVIKNASKSTLLQNARLDAKNTAWQYRGEAGKRIADFMTKTVK
ncbi:CDP-Glycerol:Poly(glycerophosphate) glycerophosphotransferase family [Treponema primitia ZAS-2]|uniref:CDP-Glycerol:Poly(Glycerophosphate) glycerophosphotransferase family n=1 Tax=Treponema primitia (strain ATCC BAA-887 / DSM 12427 / ZAS-2) TaxID=545694 RepID=F5YHH9_TREPZ|nr:CDP-glycerol glycerophosphotransferase family protein [Treponema primitia]AEF84626.1 CDP-Glycerol:Poly(glycerophosphate) glycerophosphotransferase family [Treponema primitia ZAS-2]